MGAKVLIIDDDIDHLNLTRYYLEKKGYEVRVACDGPDGLRAAYEFHPDAIVLDLMLPTVDGFEVCKRLRELSDVPILILTAREGEADELRGFGLGADDYLHKPVTVAVVEAHLSALLRRHGDGGKGTFFEYYSDPHLTLDTQARLALWEGRALHFSPTEFRLLEALLRQRGQVVPRQQLLRQVWGEAYDGDYELLALYIYYIRKKLARAGCTLPYIRTSWGEGYAFVPLEEQRVQAAQT